MTFGSISNLLIHSCHCDKPNDPAAGLVRNHRAVHSASIEFPTALNNTPSTPITDFGRSRWELSANPPTLPSLSEDLRDPELEWAGSPAPPRRNDSPETVEEFLVAIGTEDEDGEAEEAEVATTEDATDGQSVDVTNWVIRNPEKGIAMVRNQISVSRLTSDSICGILIDV